MSSKCWPLVAYLFEKWTSSSSKSNSQKTQKFIELGDLSCLLSFTLRRSWYRVASVIGVIIIQRIRRETIHWVPVGRLVGSLWLWPVANARLANFYLCVCDDALCYDAANRGWVRNAMQCMFSCSVYCALCTRELLFQFSTANSAHASSPIHTNVTKVLLKLLTTSSLLARLARCMHCMSF